MTKTQKNKKAIQQALKVCEVRAVYSHKTPAQDRMKLFNPGDSYNVLKCFYEETGHFEQKEIFSILLLDKGNKVIGWVKISEGGATATVVDIQYIFRISILSNAQNIILCHNHPSGELRPSNADTELTKKVVSAAKLLDVNVLDHMIITPDSYYSFQNEGIMP